MIQSLPVSCRLKVVVYELGTTETRTILIGQVDRDDVVVNSKAGLWYFRKDTRQEESYAIGTGIRIPEDGEKYGPMMVYDPENAIHRQRVANAQEMLRSGTLTR